MKYVFGFNGAKSGFVDMRPRSNTPYPKFRNYFNRKRTKYALTIKNMTFLAPWKSSCKFEFFKLIREY